MFDKLKSQIIFSFSKEEKESFDEALAIIKSGHLNLYPGIGISTKKGKDALIIATRKAPFKINGNFHFPDKNKYVIITYSDIDENIEIPEFEQLTEVEFRELLLAFKI